MTPASSMYLGTKCLARLQILKFLWKMKRPHISCFNEWGFTIDHFPCQLTLVSFIQGKKKLTFFFVENVLSKSI